MEKQYKIIGLGEVLWDILPSGKKLGGAPANFAYISTQLGNHGITASSVGDDADGREILQVLDKNGVDISYIQKNSAHSSGTVEVTLNEGQAIYDIKENVAWDFLELSDEWKELALKADAVCFGTLAQRKAVSRETIREFISLTDKYSLRIVDINLRQKYFSMEILNESFKMANTAKLNDAELPLVCEMFEISGNTEIEQVKNLREMFNLKTICLTRGEKGSLLISENEFSDFAGIKIQVADTIGAGDAFTAGMAHGILRNWDLNKINEFANKVGAFVATQVGAMPEIPKDLGV